MPGEAILCDHVGVLFFASALSSIAQATSPPEPLLAKWLGSILLGAVNIEQTKYLNWEDLGELLGQTVRFPTPQREQLRRLATPATIDAVLRWNHQQLVIPDSDNDLYYDPHTTHYTGTQNILKGWCAWIWATRPSWAPSKSPPAISSIDVLHPSRPPTTTIATSRETSRESAPQKSADLEELNLLTPSSNPRSVSEVWDFSGLKIHPS